MSSHSSAWLAQSLSAISVILVVPAFFLLYLNDPVEFVAAVPYSVVVLAFATVGALLASRRPDNPIGWIYCVVSLTSSVWMLAVEYARYAAVTRPGALPLPTFVVWLATESIVAVGWGLMATFAVLLFPTGRLPSRRWRPVAWFAAITIAVAAVATALRPGPVDEQLLPMRNPAGIETAAWLLGPVYTVGWPALAMAAVASGISLVLRFRPASGDEKQQLKWFTYATVFFVVMLTIHSIAEEILGPEVWRPIEPMLLAPAITSMPIAVAIAIFKYRLYDIDVIIRRTLVYALLTAMLAFFYFGGVALLQYLSQAITGGGRDQPQWAIVVSTLAIAALFQPLRRRIQRFIDRRFYRKRYHAARTLEAFAARLRDEVELNGLTEDLLAVVRETIQPEHVSLWLRPTATGSERRMAMRREQVGE